LFVIISIIIIFIINIVTIHSDVISISAFFNYKKCYYTKYFAK